MAVLCANTWLMRLMDEKRVILIKHSWSYVVSDRSGFGSLLCKMIINLSADLKPIVRQLRAEHQIQNILETLDKIVLSLPDFSTTEPEVITFVARYSEKRITNENYELGVIALLMCLQKKVRSWTPEFHEAWIFLFASIHVHFVDKVGTDPRLTRLLERKNNFQNEK
jgi:hypothetical protein